MKIENDKPVYAASNQAIRFKTKGPPNIMF